MNGGISVTIDSHRYKGQAWSVLTGEGDLFSLESPASRLDLGGGLDCLVGVVSADDGIGLGFS